MGREYDFAALREEEITGLYPELSKVNDIFSYELTKDKKRIALAVFFREKARPTEAVLYTLSREEEAEIPYLKRFFESCAKALKKNGMESIYHKSTGTMEELIIRHELLTECGFEPRVFIGELYECRLGDLRRSRFMREYALDPAAWVDCISLSEKMSIQERQLLLFLSKDSEHLQNRLYSPDFSFLCTEDGEKGGVLCMNLAGDLLSSVTLLIRAEDKEERLMYLHALLAALISSAGDLLPEETRIQLSFDELTDRRETFALLPETTDRVHYQEFLLSI